MLSIWRLRYDVHGGGGCRERGREVGREVGRKGSREGGREGGMSGGGGLH